MMACGYAVVKCGLIDAKSSKTLSVICIYIIMPCVMINASRLNIPEASAMVSFWQ